MDDTPDHKPTETVGREIRVHVLSDHNRERIAVGSIEEAISTVKRQSTVKTVARKIEVDGEIVYSSKRNGDIEEWERAYERAKMMMGADETVYECPYDTPGCYQDDYCFQCQMDRAQESARE